MASANDSVIIGSVLALVFGALFYYLYSRLLYSEKRINMMENILLDFKTASESFFVAGSGATGGEGNNERASEHEHTYEAPVESSPTRNESVEDVTIAQPLTADTVVAARSETTGIGMNYESMHLKELQQEAKRRGIPGTKRKEIIQNLRADDNTNATKGSELSSLSSQLHNTESALTEGLAPIREETL